MSLNRMCQDLQKLQGLSPIFCAVVEHILVVPEAERRVSPTVYSVSVTSDGFALLNGGRYFLGSALDLEGNLKDLAQACGWDKAVLMGQAQKRIQDWRPQPVFGRPL